MADVIKSRNLQGKPLMDKLKNLVADVNQRQPSFFLSPATITLGDEFQAILTSLKSGIETIIHIEENVVRKNLDFKLRYLINFGIIETTINPDLAYEMLGEGLTHARESLNKLKKSYNRISIDINNNRGDMLNNLFKIYTFLTDTWKRDDYKIISLFIQEKDYKIVSQKLHRERSAVWRKEKSLHMHQYFLVKKLIHQTLDL